MRPIGYLTPSGDYIECNSYDHYAVAEEICKRMNWERSSCNCAYADEILLLHGFVKLFISVYGTKEYHVYWNKEHFLTEAQKSWLKTNVFDEFLPENDPENVYFIPFGYLTKIHWETEIDN